MKIEVLSIWLICLLIVSCEGVPADWSLEENRVNFSAHIEGITTRATNTTWHKSDQVGIYMKDAGKSLIENTLHNNAKYINPSGNSSFTAASESDALYFPSTGNKVDFIAYYPIERLLMILNTRLMSLHRLICLTSILCIQITLLILTRTKERLTSLSHTSFARL